jgi:hypothetical protein
MLDALHETGADVTLENAYNALLNESHQAELLPIFATAAKPQCAKGCVSISKTTIRASLQNKSVEEEVRRDGGERSQTLEEENTRLKRLVAYQALNIQILRELN